MLPAAGSRRPGAAPCILAAVLCVAAVSWAFAQPGSPIPDPDTAAMEPQVREKIARERRLVAEDPGSAARWGSLGRAFQAHGLEPEADEAYRRAEELDPADFRWPYLRASALRNVRPEDALTAAGRAAELNPRYAPAHLLAAELLESAGSAGAAMDRYRRALETAPDAAPAELGIGRLLLRRGELEAARKRLERAAALAPRAGPVHAELARLYTRQGNAEAARRAAEAARDLPDLVPVDDPVLTEVWDEAVSARGYQQRALRAEAAGDFGAAEALYDHLLGLQPGDPDILYNFGNLYVRTRRFGEAAERYLEALAARPEHVAARVNLGSALLMLGRRDQAMEHLLRALEHDPADPDANRTLGGLFAYRGDNEAAIRHYRAVLARDPQDGPVHRDLAIVLAAEGEFPTAWEHVEAAERLGSPPTADFLLRLQEAHPRPPQVNDTAVEHPFPSRELILGSRVPASCREMIGSCARRCDPVVRIANVALTNGNDAPRVFDWLQTTHPDRRPDIVTIQKTGPEASFPKRALSEIGYETCCPGGPKHYLGVAVLSHRDLPPPETVDCGLPNATEGESRFLTVSIGSLWVSSVYIPYKVYVPYKPEGLRRPDVICRRVRWLNHLREHILDKGYDRQDTVLCGDFNVKFLADGPRKGLYGQDDEDALQAILDLGFVDIYRDSHPDPETKPGHTHGYQKDPEYGTSRLHLMLASRSVARYRRDVRLVGASPKPAKDGPPLVVDLDGLKV